MPTVGPTRHPRSGSVQVIDPGLLGRVTKQTVMPHFGTQTEAAAAMGIDQSSLSRLLRGRAGKAITLDVFYAIGRFVGLAGRGPELRRAVLNPGATSLLQKYRSWLQEELRDFNQEVLPRIGADRCRTVARKDASGFSEQGIMRETAYQHVLMRLQQREPGKWHLKGFERKARKMGWRPGMARFELALRRVVGPLATAGETGYLERGWEELLVNDRQLVAYLNAALAKELILLNRQQDLQRAQRLASYVDERGQPTFVDTPRRIRKRVKKRR